MKFQKCHGNGNDFIIINGFKEKDINYQKVSSFLCRPKWGIGADGLIVLLPSDKADYSMVIFNSDGSEAEMCGNGIRCLGRYIYENMNSSASFSIETKGGIKFISCIKGEKGMVNFVWVEMGKPVFERNKIPMTGDNISAFDVPLLLNGENFKLNCLSLGNPHCVIFPDDWENSVLSSIGPAIENNPLFPNKINVELVKVLSEDKIKMKVWERGVGITHACGTGACASAVVSIVKGYVHREVDVLLPGGTLKIRLDKNDIVHMGGEVKVVYNGELSNELLEELNEIDKT